MRLLKLLGNYIHFHKIQLYRKLRLAIKDWDINFATCLYSCVIRDLNFSFESSKWNDWLKCLKRICL